MESTITQHKFRQPGNNWDFGSPKGARVFFSSKLTSCLIILALFVFNNTSAQQILADREASNVVQCETGIEYGTWIEGGFFSSDNYLSLTDGQFVEFLNGTALFTGTITHIGFPGQGFTLSVQFGDRTFDAPAGSPKDLSCGQSADMDSWYYYQEINGVFIGWGEFAGAVLQVSRSGAAFQVGVGANLHDAELFGASGWLDFDLISQPDNNEIVFSDFFGDFNLRLSGDPLGSCEDPNDLSLSAGADGTSVSASWSPVAGAGLYKIRLRPAGASGWTQTEYLPGDAASFEFTGLNECNEYQVKIRTECGNSPDDYSEVAEVTTEGCEPDCDGLIPNIEFGSGSVACPGQSFDFNASDAGAGITYSWNFDEGADPPNASGQSVSNVSWNTLGPKIVTLTISDEAGCSQTDQVSIMVEECPASISGVTFDDNNGNGIQDEGEGVLPGVEVLLYLADDLTIPVQTQVSGPDGEYSFTGLTPGLEYIIQFVKPDGYLPTTYPGDGFTGPITPEFNENIEGIDAGFIAETDPGGCGNPEDLSLSAGPDATSLTASWTPVEAAIFYKIRLRPFGSSSWTTTVYPGGTSSEYTFTGLESCSEYQVKLRAKCGGDDDPSYTDVVNAFTTGCDPVECDIPENLSVDTDPSGTSVTVSWDDASGAESYLIEYRPAGTFDFSQTFTAGTSKIITGLMSCTEYDIRVKSICADGQSSDFTDILIFTTVNCSPDECTAPANVSVNVMPSGTMAEINWTGSPGALAYKVRVRAAGTTIWTITAVTSDLSYIAMGMDPCSDYETKVQTACQDGTRTGYSDVVPFTTNGCDEPDPGDICEAPTGLSAEVAPDGLSAEISWNAVDGSSDYNVSYREQGTLFWVIETTSENYITIFNLNACNQYEYTVSAYCPDGGISDNSESAVFNTEACDVEEACDIPGGLGSQDVTESSAVLSWDAVVEVDKYKLQYRPLGTNVWNTVSVYSSESYAVEGLLCDTDYEFRVSAKCPDGWTRFSYKEQFTTQQCIAPRSFNQDAIPWEAGQLNLYPNPAVSFIIVDYMKAKEGDVQLGIYDVLGRLLYNSRIDFGTGLNTIQLNLDNYTNGVYFLEIVDGNFEQTMQFIISR